MEPMHPLKAFRESRDPKMSQDELGTLIGVSRETVWRWETGERFPARKLWKKIEEVTGIPASRLTEFSATEDDDEAQTVAA